MPSYRAVPSRDAKRPDDDLRVIKGGSGNIISDRRNQNPSSIITTPKPLTSPSAPASYSQQPQKPSAVPKPRQIVKGKK